MTNIKDFQDFLNSFHPSAVDEHQSLLPFLQSQQFLFGNMFHVSYLQFELQNFIQLLLSGKEDQFSELTNLYTILHNSFKWVQGNAAECDFSDYFRQKDHLYNVSKFNEHFVRSAQIVSKAAFLIQFVENCTLFIKPEADLTKLSSYVNEMSNFYSRSISFTNLQQEVDKSNLTTETKKQFNRLSKLKVKLFLGKDLLKKIASLIQFISDFHLKKVSFQFEDIKKLVNEISLFIRLILSFQASSKFSAVSQDLSKIISFLLLKFRSISPILMKHYKYCATEQSFLRNLIFTPSQIDFISSSFNQLSIELRTLHLVYSKYNQSLNFIVNEFLPIHMKILDLFGPIEDKFKLNSENQDISKLIFKDDSFSSIKQYVSTTYKHFFDRISDSFTHKLTSDRKTLDIIPQFLGGLFKTLSELQEKYNVNGATRFASFQSQEKSLKENHSIHSEIDQQHNSHSSSSFNLQTFLTEISEGHKPSLPEKDSYSILMASSTLLNDIYDQLNVLSLSHLLNSFGFDISQLLLLFDGAAFTKFLVKKSKTTVAIHHPDSTINLFRTDKSFQVNGSLVNLDNFKILCTEAVKAAKKKQFLLVLMIMTFLIIFLSETVLLFNKVIFSLFAQNSKVLLLTKI